MKSIIAAALAGFAAAQSSGAEQIHLAVTGDPTSMAVGYSYQNGCPSGSTVNYGSTTAMSLSTTASMTTDSLSGDCWLTAVMTGLKPNIPYFYSIDGGEMFKFINQPVRGGGKIYAVLADFGMVNDVALAQLTAEAANRQFDAVIHAGDFAYDLQDNYGALGDEFMNGLQNVSSILPYMGCPGNHESDDDTFAQYQGRFNLYSEAAANSGNNNGMLWYSFNDGLVHFFSIDTELFAYGGTEQQISDMYAWLQADLAAVDRSITPWVIGFGHKQNWMDKVDFTVIASLLKQYNVDMYFCGHMHNYQRTFSFDATTNTTDPECMPDTNTYLNCPNTINMVVGSPGCKEGLSALFPPSNYMVNSAQAYGYGHLQVHNATHASWGWEMIGQRDLTSGEFKPQVGAFYDSALIINENHLSMAAAKKA